MPSTVSIEEVRDSILGIEGVLSLHELHVWQLSESKIIASVHVLASRNHEFMPVAAKIRNVLHLRGIHSCTIQPEYYHPQALAEEHLRVRANANSAVRVVLTAIQITGETSCLITCPPDRACDPSENSCCREYLYGL